MNLAILCCRAVEFGLMSTTTDKGTAFKYSGTAKDRGTVLEIAAGRIDVGASISFLSQYPKEEEFLMQPLACLEVRGHIILANNLGRGFCNLC